MQDKQHFYNQEALIFVVCVQEFFFIFIKADFHYFKVAKYYFI